MIEKEGRERKNEWQGTEGAEMIARSLPLLPHESTRIRCCAAGCRWVWAGFCMCTVYNVCERIDVCRGVIGREKKRFEQKKKKGGGGGSSPKSRQQRFEDLKTRQTKNVRVCARARSRGRYTDRK